MESVNKLVERLKATGEQGTTDRGQPIWRHHWSSERYLVDFADNFTAEGWEQFDTDQDAHYFGQWVNPKTLTTLCYCEGDWSVVECADKKAYNAEIQSMIDFYGEGRIALVIDPEAKTSTEYKQDRHTFLLAESEATA